MFLYWRIGLDLEDMGEYIVFNDPRFVRCFKQWIKKNYYALAMLQDDDFSKSLEPALN